MNHQTRCRLSSVGVALVAATILAQDGPVRDAGPLVLTPTVSTLDAPELTPTVYGLMRQNAYIDWTLIGPGPTAGQDAAYLFTSIVREESIEGETPVFAFINLADGAITSIYPGSKIKVRESKPALDLDAVAVRKDAAMEMEAPAAEMTTSWVWERAISGARASSNAIYLGTDVSERAKPMLLRFFPRDNRFEELTTLSQPAVGMAVLDGMLWYLTRDGALYTYDDIGGPEQRARLPASTGPCQGLFADQAGTLYTKSAQYPFRIMALQRMGQGVKVIPLLADKSIESAVFHDSLPGPWGELVLKEAGGHFRTERVLFKDGQATVFKGKPDESALAAKRGYEIDIDYNEEPLRMGIRRGAGEWTYYPIVFDRTGRDKLKELCPGPDGKYLYGAGWPVAWIWRFDPETGRYTILGRHYVFYEMLPWKDELWVCGYWGIKLLRWHTEEPFTFDYPRHYEKKTYPGNTSPWGDKDVSNPRLVCKFRYLKKLNVRRPGGMAIGPDGFAYVGGRTPAVEYFESRYGGAVSWYDPETETIGQIREPFLHHSVRDVCRAGDRYIAAAASDYMCMFEPLPTNYSRGKFVLYDTVAKTVALDISPLDAPYSYCEEGVSGRVVVAASHAGKYAGDGVRTAFFIFDVAQMRVTHVIRLPIKANWAEYNVLPFQKGPDDKIYFYGADSNGVALFRIDSVSGAVEPVMRAKGMTDVATYNVPGAPFAFFKDRLYFGVNALMSVPLSTVMGGK
jgi:hypothetical protein